MRSHTRNTGREEDQDRREGQGGRGARGGRAAGDGRGNGWTNDAWQVFSETYLKPLSWSFLVLALMRLWLQYNLYNLHFTPDAGDFTMVINLVRGLVIFALLGLVVMRPPSVRTWDILGWCALVAMTLSSILIFLQSFYDDDRLVIAGVVLGAFGITWMGAMIMRFFARMKPGMAFLSTFLSLAAGSLLCLLFGLIPRSATLVADILIPAVMYLSCWQATRLLDERSGVASGVEVPPDDTVYDSEPKRNFVQLLVGMGLFAFVMGINQGFPAGYPTAVSQGMQVAHQLLTAGIALLAVYWALVKRRGADFRVIWAIETVLIAIGISLLMAEDAGVFSAGVMVNMTANALFLGIIWYACYDVGNHMKAQSYIVLAIPYAIYLLMRDAGRVMILVLGDLGVSSILVLVGMVFVLALSMVLILAGNVPKVRPLFAGLSGSSQDVGKGAEEGADLLKRGASSSGLSHGQPLHVSHDARSEIETWADGGGREESRGDRGGHEESLDDRIDVLGERYGLTEREREVARSLACGRSRAVIADSLCISENTVRNYTTSMYQKLGVHSKQEYLDILEALRGR